jgi:FKBP-type peptidyl-prolyl cis-trans isomerases 1
MRKVVVIFMAVVIAAFVSCTHKSPEAILKTEIDSLSYAFGMARTNELYRHLVENSVDTAYMADFIKGFNKGISDNSKEILAYSTGVQIGRMVKEMWITELKQQILEYDPNGIANENDVFAGFIAGAMRDNSKMSMQFAISYHGNAMLKMREARILEQYSENKKAGEKFLAENKNKEGVITTESGLQYKVIKQGKGKTPSWGSEIKLKHKGTLIDGTEFDSSKNNSTIFYTDRVISGWAEALMLMPVGSKWELYVPHDLAYGSAGAGVMIKPFSALVYEIELLEVIR